MKCRFPLKQIRRLSHESKTNIYSLPQWHPNSVEENVFYEEGSGFTSGQRFLQSHKGVEEKRERLYLADRHGIVSGYALTRIHQAIRHSINGYNKMVKITKS